MLPHFLPKRKAEIVIAKVCPVIGAAAKFSGSGIAICAVAPMQTAATKAPKKLLI